VAAVAALVAVQQVAPAARQRVVATVAATRSAIFQLSLTALVVAAVERVARVPRVLAARLAMVARV
jgi:hypothetical protein